MANLHLMHWKINTSCSEPVAVKYLKKKVGSQIIDFTICTENKEQGDMSVWPEIKICICVTCICICICEVCTRD